MSASPSLPAHIRDAIGRAVRLEWWSLFWLGTVVVAMDFAAGSSQAMHTAWLEDLLSLIPPLLVIVTAKVETRGPSRDYPYGLHRVGSLAFFGAAMALTGMGLMLLVQAVLSLAQAEHPTIGTVVIGGTTVWLGWVMVGVLLYSTIPPVLLGHAKLLPARESMDKVLFTDAIMNKADWQTGVAGMVGVLGIGIGLWWADAAAAAFISLSILRDGVRSLRIATAELLDGAPRELESADKAADIARLEAAILDLSPGTRLMFRETGRFVRMVCTQPQGGCPVSLEQARRIMGETGWRLIQMSSAASGTPTTRAL